MLDEGFEAVVDCGERDIGKAVFHAHEDLVGGGVCFFFGEDSIHLAALTSHAQSADFVRDFDGVCERVVMHVGRKMEWFQNLSRTIPILIQNLWQ